MLIFTALFDIRYLNIGGKVLSVVMKSLSDFKFSLNHLKKCVHVRVLLSVYLKNIK